MVNPADCNGWPVLCNPTTRPSHRRVNGIGCISNTYTHTDTNIFLHHLRKFVLISPRTYCSCPCIFPTPHTITKLITVAKKFAAIYYAFSRCDAYILRVCVCVVWRNRVFSITHLGKKRCICIPLIIHNI